MIWKSRPSCASAGRARRLLGARNRGLLTSGATVACWCADNAPNRWPSQDHKSDYLAVFLVCVCRTSLKFVRLLLDGLRLLRHQLGEALVLAQGGELGLCVHLLDVFVTFFHGFTQILERVVHVAGLGVHLGHHEGERSAVSRRSGL